MVKPIPNMTIPNKIVIYPPIKENVFGEKKASAAKINTQMANVLLKLTKTF